MGTMFKQLWAMLTMMFGAGETLAAAASKGAKALDHLGTWCEESAGSFADQARIEREQKKLLLLGTVERPNQAVLSAPTATQQVQ